MYVLSQVMFLRTQFWLGKSIAFLTFSQLSEAPQYSLYETMKLWSFIVALFVMFFLLLLGLTKIGKRVKNLEDTSPGAIQEKQKINILKDGIE